jgi:NAD-dependent deacetylase
LWENYRIEDVATPQAWIKDPELVLEFYNQRRKQVIEAKPNDAHYYLAQLEKDFNVQVITQNIDDLHERAGSKTVLHLHGEIRKSQSNISSDKVYSIVGESLVMGDFCPEGNQLRPHVVWFGEDVPNLIKAALLCNQADVFIVIGTSLQVYPAANLIYEIKPSCKAILVDPNANEIDIEQHQIVVINKTAVEGVKELKVALAEWSKSF